MARESLDRQFAKRVESGQCPTDVAIAAAYVRALSIEEAAGLLGVSEERLRRWSCAGYSRRSLVGIAPIREAREQYEETRKLVRGRETYQKRLARIAELEAEIQNGIEAQKKAHQQLMRSANMYRSELIHAVEDAKGTAPKKAARARKRILRECQEFVTGCERAHVDLPAHKDGSRA